jgi:predicted NAD/FAD-binding protein
MNRYSPLGEDRLMRIAVVGSGVAGLGAAYVLSRAHDVHVFERDGRAGGHANTVVHDGLALDTGFLVHNERNYPLLGRLFRELGVATHESDMSFSVSCRECGLEYSGRRPFAQPRNAASPKFLSLMREIGRWLRTARPEDDSQSLEDYLDAHGYSERFRRHFLVPLTSALWSTAPGRALEFPAAYAIRFFDNHGMLGFGRFKWRTVTGGSRTYVDAIGKSLGGGLRLGAGVRSIRRTADGVELRVGDEVGRYDRVVIATHADEALELLEDPTAHERSVLGRFAYTVNEATLHTDSSFLPKARAARASWNYRLGDDGRPTITYHLNRLQALDADKDYCLTLNESIPAEHVLERITYTHPLFTVASMQAQAELPGIAGDRTAYAGAYFGNGFHEDGLASGVAAARAFGVEW